MQTIPFAEGSTKSQRGYVSGPSSSRDRETHTCPRPLLSAVPMHCLCLCPARRGAAQQLQLYIQTGNQSLTSCQVMCKWWTSNGLGVRVQDCGSLLPLEWSSCEEAPGFSTSNLISCELLWPCSALIISHFSIFEIQMLIRRQNIASLLFFLFCRVGPLWDGGKVLHMQSLFSRRKLSFYLPELLLVPLEK